MGRGYEDGVQLEVWRGIKWLSNQPKDIFNDKVKVKKLESIMIDDTHPSGASHGCTISHTRYMHENGYDKWFSELKKVRKPEEEQEYDLDNMMLLPEMTEEEKADWHVEA